MRIAISASITGLLLISASSAIAEATTCSTVAACVMGTNSNAGYGVEGTSKANNGVVGMTLQNATSAATGKAGVSGYDDSTNKSTYDSGVYGTSAYGDGVQGKSTAGYGVVGTLLSNRTQQPRAGVAGYDTTVGGYRDVNSGVSGRASDAGMGVQGVSASGVGVFGTATTGDGIGVYAYNSNTSTTSPGGVGLIANVVQGTAIAAISPPDAALLRGYDGPNETVSLSGAGDLTLSGTVSASVGDTRRYGGGISRERSVVRAARSRVCPHDRCAFEISRLYHARGRFARTVYERRDDAGVCGARERGRPVVDRVCLSYRRASARRRAETPSPARRHAAASTRETPDRLALKPLTARRLRRSRSRRDVYRPACSRSCT
jgi:hypothetical protein